MMSAQKITAGDGGHRPAAAKKNTQQTNSSSTATEAQIARVVAALRTGPKTSYQLSRMGIYHPPRRIKDLRDRGFAISTERVTLTDADGFQHIGCALYVLAGEPLGVGGCE